MSRLYLLVFQFLFLQSLVCMSQTLECMSQTFSPNGKIKVEYVGGYQLEELQVSYKGTKGWQKIMSMPVTLSCEKIYNPKKVEKVDYEMPHGKKLHCTNAYRTICFPLTEGYQLWVNVYNDGVAWTSTGGRVNITEDKKDDENYCVSFSEAKNNWMMKWTDSYEGFFPKNSVQPVNTRMGYPALFEFDNDVFALLSESAIDADYAASSFYTTAVPNNFNIRNDGDEMDGYQTLIIGSLSDVVESTLITDNSKPCRLSDTSWIQPGVASWIYWAYNHGSNDISIIRKYIDLAVKLNMPYILIDAEWDEMPKIASNEGKTIVDAVKECTDNGVKPIIWYNSSVGWINGAPGPKFRLNKPEDMEKEFAWCEKIGVKGVKIDFFSGDNNLNIRYMVQLLECAAKHHLLVNFHGATIPRGLQRTYPNLISTEGVYGAEWYNNVPTFTDKAAAHNATLPFTRNVVGPMDYTPCAFSDSQHPHITTHAHELALTVLYESGIQHIADRPESLLAQPEDVKSFFKELPTAWDETRLLAGYPGESVVMARRSGKVWYIAGINGLDKVNDISSIDLSKLKHSGKHFTLFQDSGNKQEPWKVTHSDKLQLDPCQPRGGFVVKVW